jgi:hypothetical protein
MLWNVVGWVAVNAGERCARIGERVARAESKELAARAAVDADVQRIWAPIYIHRQSAGSQR